MGIIGAINVTGVIIYGIRHTLSQRHAHQENVSRHIGIRKEFVDQDSLFFSKECNTVSMTRTLLITSSYMAIFN